jgi:hypothetical protein
MTLARKLAADAIANVRFESEADYFVALSSVQAGIGVAFEYAARMARQHGATKPLARRLREMANDETKPAQDAARAPVGRDAAEIMGII